MKYLAVLILTTLSMTTLVTGQQNRVYPDQQKPQSYPQYPNSQQQQQAYPQYPTDSQQQVYPQYPKDPQQQVYPQSPKDFQQQQQVYPQYPNSQQQQQAYPQYPTDSQQQVYQKYPTDSQQQKPEGYHQHPTHSEQQQPQVYPQSKLLFQRQQKETRPVLPTMQIVPQQEEPRALPPMLKPVERRINKLTNLNPRSSSEEESGLSKEHDIQFIKNVHQHSVRHNLRNNDEGYAHIAVPLVRERSSPLPPIHNLATPPSDARFHESSDEDQEQIEQF